MFSSRSVALVLCIAMVLCQDTSAGFLGSLFGSRTTQFNNNADGTSSVSTSYSPFGSSSVSFSNGMNNVQHNINNAAGVPSTMKIGNTVMTSGPGGSVMTSGPGGSVMTSGFGGSHMIMD